VVEHTAPSPERETQSQLERLGVPEFEPPPDTADDSDPKNGSTLEHAGGGSPDLAWMKASDTVDARWISAGERLPIGVETFLGREHNDLVLWIDRVRAVISGDTLVDFGRGLEINDWLRGGLTREEVAERLRPLLERPVEVVLPAHGAPTDRAALERALTA
jgi:glyoxylase-like metal-dependent hydrolase (beta-lactamase superfamily II)